MSSCYLNWSIIDFNQLLTYDIWCSFIIFSLAFIQLEQASWICLIFLWKHFILCVDLWLVIVRFNGLFEVLWRCCHFLNAFRIKHCFRYSMIWSFGILITLLWGLWLNILSVHVFIITLVWVTVTILVQSLHLRLLVFFQLCGTPRLLICLIGDHVFLLDYLLIHEDQQLIPIGFLVIIFSLKLLTRLLLGMVNHRMISGILCDFGGYEYLLVFLSIVCFLDYGIILNYTGWFFVVDAPFSHFVLFHVDRQDLFL